MLSVTITITITAASADVTKEIFHTVVGRVQVCVIKRKKISHF